MVDASERPSHLAIGGEVTYSAELLSVKPIGYKGQHVISDVYLAQFENVFVWRLHVPYDNLNHNASYRISHYFAVRLMIILKRYSYSYVDRTFVKCCWCSWHFLFCANNLSYLTEIYPTLHHHYHHHHRPCHRKKVLGILRPVNTWSWRCSWSFHLCFGLPSSRRIFGWCWKGSIGRRYYSIFATFSHLRLSWTVYSRPNCRLSPTLVLVCLFVKSV